VKRFARSASGGAEQTLRAVLRSSLREPDARHRLSANASSDPSNDARSFFYFLHWSQLGLPPGLRRIRLTPASEQTK
jgi:hypothetical protein